MKKIFVILFVIVTFVAYPVKAQKNEREINRTAKQINNMLETISTYTEVLITSNNPDVFWEYIQSASKEYQNYQNNNSNLKKNVENKLAKYLIPEDIVSDSTFNAVKEMLSGVSTISVDISNTPNACVAPSGQIYITSKLLELMTAEEIIGILAHETAHYKLKHTIIKTFTEERKRRNNNIAAAIGSGLMVAADAYAVANGVEVNTQQTVDVAYDLFYAAEVSAMKYKYKYSREMEIDADIVAIRFLQWLEIDPNNYISALSRLADYNKSMGLNVSTTNIYDTHPSLLYRAVVMKVMLLNEAETAAQNEMIKNSKKEL